MRAMLAHEYGRDYGERAFYLDTDFYKDGNDAARDKPLEIVKGILSDLERDKCPMVSRYVDKSVVGDSLSSRCNRYAEVPIWVAVEAISFGRVTNFVSYVKDVEPAKRAISIFGIQWAPFAKVLHSLCVLRNLCAHHRQLWNRRMSIQCPFKRSSDRATLSLMRQAPMPSCLCSTVIVRESTEIRAWLPRLIHFLMRVLTTQRVFCCRTPNRLREVLTLTNEMRLEMAIRERHSGEFTNRLFEVLPISLYRLSLHRVCAVPDLL